MSEKLEERRALYDSGLNDKAISRRLGVDRSTISTWRRKQGLPPNAPSIPKPFEVAPMRRLLFDLGWGYRSVAAFQGVSVGSLQEFRARHRIPPRRPQKAMNAKQREKQLRDLQRRVIKAVGCRLPFDIAADAAAELMLGVIEGTVPLDQIERQGRVYGNRALNEYANAFTTKSLDADLPDHDGFRPVDMLVDEASSGWLEEMGATVH